jgi:hypothetical protein
MAYRRRTAVEALSQRRQGGTALKAFWALSGFVWVKKTFSTQRVKGSKKLPPAFDPLTLCVEAAFLPTKIPVAPYFAKKKQYETWSLLCIFMRWFGSGGGVRAGRRFFFPAQSHQAIIIFKRPSNSRGLAHAPGFRQRRDCSARQSGRRDGDRHARRPQPERR